MLRGLDKIRTCGNVIFFCTTNFISNIDSAFVDRVFLRRLINAPVVGCVYEILRSELNSLIQCGKVIFDTMIYDEIAAFDEGSIESTTHSLSSPLASQVRLKCDNPFSSPPRIPSKTWADTHWAGLRHTAATQLFDIALQAKGLSGRRLGDLVEQARVGYTVDEPCDLRELLDALDRVVREETREGQQDSILSSVSKVGAAMQETRPVDIAALLAEMEADRATSTTIGD